MNENARAELEKLLARLTGTTASDEASGTTTDFNVGQVPELNSTEKNVRAEEQTNQLFDMLTSLKNMSSIQTPLAATIVQTLVDALEPDLMRAMLFALLGIVEKDQLHEGRRVMTELARSGALVEMFETVLGEEY